MKRSELPKQFLASGIHCGAKKKRKDLALLYSSVPCRVAAIFTKNRVKAAPVKVAQQQLKNTNKIRAVIINSGNANCMTGERGISDAKKTMASLAEILKVKSEEVITSSTGVIGKFMPMDAILSGMNSLVGELSEKGLVDAADGIRTTDQFRKMTARTFKLGGKKVILTGIAKGAGMIKPDMATMLCFIMTDAAIAASVMKKALKKCAEVSFNAISVDGDMSTNDTVMLLANGAAGNKTITEEGKDLDLFQENLDSVAKELARMIVRDGEGASRVIEVQVKGTRTDKDAATIARTIADSLLVKCAVLGGDPNWGRIASSAGASGVDLDPDKMEVKLDSVTFFKNGTATPPDHSELARVFKAKEVLIEVDLHSGEGKASAYSCDITKKYLMFNSKYTT